MNRSIIKAAFVCVTSVSAILAQAVSFSSPASWITQRNDTVFIRAQLDTALIKKKAVSVSLLQVNEGKKKVIAKKDLKITDNVMELFFAKVGKDLVGGKEFLRLEWALADNSEKGTIEPIGILDLKKVQKSDTVKALRVQDGVEAKSVADMIKAEQTKKIGSVEFGTAWNKNALFIVMKKGQDNSLISFAFDGKNGKNAFLSYPDRIISYIPAKDSLNTTHYNRDIKVDTLRYTDKLWQSEIKKETVVEKVVISMPWSDIGVIPFEERMVGMAVFAQQDGKIMTAIPQNAQFYIPGTWGDLFLQK